MIDLIEVRSEGQIAEVAHLAREIWQEHYMPIIGKGQVDYMVEKFQSERAIAGQLADGYEYYLVTHDEKHVGYTAVVPKESEASLLISKIYVKKSIRGHGVGQKMLEFVEELCRQRRIKKMWLTVNKNNSRSIAWYYRKGFINTGPLLQDIGGGFVMDDFRMEKTLG